MARTTSVEISDELTREICNNVTAGMPARAAAALAGVDRAQFSEWMRKAKKGTDPFLTLAHEIDKAALTAQRRVVASVSLAATQDPKVGMKFLALRYPEDWSEHDQEKSAHIEVESGSADDIKELAARIRSRAPLLPWEDGDEFEGLVSRLIGEYQPQGPTEEHLIEELAGTLLRKERLRLAENASHRHGLRKLLKYDSKEVVRTAVAHLTDEKPEDTLLAALTASDEETASELKEQEANQAAAQKALSILASKKGDRFPAALAALGPRKEWWDSALSRAKSKDDEVGTIYEDSAQGLETFLRDEAEPWCTKWVLGLKNRALVRQQAFGDSFSAAVHEGFSRIEAMLDRKMEKILDRLLQLQERRRAPPAG